MEKKKSRYSYTKGEKNINRAFKMHEIELAALESCSDRLANDILNHENSLQKSKTDLNGLKDRVEFLKSKAAAIAAKRGIEIPNSMKTPMPKVAIPPIDNSPYLADEKISQDEIPSWEDVMSKTDEMVPEDVVLEDLLSKEEFQYCIDDVKRINEEFAQKTKLNKIDIIFLMTATALQTARWIIIQHLMGDLGETINQEERILSQEGDKQKKKGLNDWNKQNDGRENIDSEKGYPTWKDIIFGQYQRTDGCGKSAWVCPYDAQENSPVGFENGGRGNHRVHTLGHDPVLGWIFGTANIMTCTISLNKQFGFSTYRVQYPGGRFGQQINMPLMFKEVYESTCEDKFRLAAGIVAQCAHLKSDVFTSRGLPVPLVEVFSENMAGRLYSEQYDALCLARDTKIVGTQAVIAILINMIIGFVHGLFYNQEKDGNRDHYEVRTRKILLYSNLISTGINAAYVGVNAYLGNAGEALKKLDLGGLLVTLWRLFADVRFITKVKEAFIRQEFDKVTKESLEELDSMFEQSK